ncbi:MAG: hypothetical protein ACLQNE_28885 [Thermoguttaceae bacterium]|jgi:hypothetical protein
MVLLEVVGRYSIPIFRLAEAESLPQPPDIKTPVLQTVPVSRWNWAVKPDRLELRDGRLIEAVLKNV